MFVPVHACLCVCTCMHVWLHICTCTPIYIHVQIWAVCPMELFLSELALCQMLTLVLPPLWPHKAADPAERCLSPRIIVFITHSPRCWGTHSEHSAMETEGISRSSVVGLSRTRTTVFLLSPLSLPESLSSPPCLSVQAYMCGFICMCVSAYVEVRGQPWVPCVRCYPPFCFSDTGSLWPGTHQVG